jgi:hypothetical protein
MKETQLYLRTSHTWNGNHFDAETKFLPSVYVAKLSVRLNWTPDDEQKESLETALLNILEEKIKPHFKHSLEDSNERGGFLESATLTRLSDRLARLAEDTLRRYQPCTWESAID